MSDVIEVSSSFKSDLIRLMKHHNENLPNNYENPHLLAGILNSIEEVWGESDELVPLWDWAMGKWDM